MDENRGKRAFELHSQIADAEAKRRHMYADIMYALAEMYSEEYYKEFLGDEEAEWAGYLAEIDVYFSRNQVKDFIRIYNKYSRDLGLSRYEYISIPKSRLIEMMPLVHKENIEEWMGRASNLTSKDWKIEVRKAKGLITEDDEHTHEDKVYKECKVCGRKEHETNS